MIVAGIDAGQSSTTAALAREHGEILGRGFAGPADEIGADERSTRLRDALEGALHNALLAARLPAETRFDAIVAGVSGYEGTVYGLAPRLPSERVELMHDAPVAHAGALDGGPGVVVIAGTGSVAYAVAVDGATRMAGGWGYLFGDEGSAFWIARNALALACTHDGCPAVEPILSFFDVHSMRELVRGFYTGRIAREAIASFAPHCIEAAKSHETCACLEEPVYAASSELANLAATAAFPDEAVRVAFTGGLMRDAWFKRTVYEKVEGLAGATRFTVVEPARDPAAGAVALALRLASASR